jgi:rod shape-determining protein MreC
MRTTFDAPNQRRSEPLRGRRISLLLALFLVALGLILLDGQGLLDPVKSRAQRVLEPMAQTLTQARISVGDAVGGVTGRGAMQTEIDALKQQLSAAQDKNVKLEALLYENFQLKQQLQIQQTYGWSTVEARVVQGSADSGQRIVRINRGKQEGLAVGMAVVAKEGGSPAALIGVVDKVYAQAADVLLIIDYGSTISARTAGSDTPAEGLIAGQWQVGSRLKLTDVGRDVALVAGQYVVTAGLSQSLATNTPIAQIPRDVPIGTILATSQSGHSQTAEVQPFVDPDRVRDVWIITGTK